MNLVFYVVIASMLGQVFASSVAVAASSEVITDISVSDLIARGEIPKLPYPKFCVGSLGERFIYTDVCLNLSGKGLTSLAGLSAVPEIHTVERLYFANNRLLSIVARDLACLSNLCYLYLENNQLEVIEHDSFESLQRLEGLILENNRIKDATSICRIVGQLRHIYLKNNEIEHFEPIQSSPRLEHLDLSNNKITNLPKLLDLFPALTSLCLDGDAHMDLE